MECSAGVFSPVRGVGPTVVVAGHSVHVRVRRVSVEVHVAVPVYQAGAPVHSAMELVEAPWIGNI
jgi:hypothetical protein